MRCAECGEKITGRSIKRGNRAFCSVDCAESATEDKFDEDDDQEVDDFDTLDDDELEFETDSGDRDFSDDDR